MCIASNMANDLEVLDTNGKLTDRELKSLQEIARYWQAGKIVTAMMFAIGGVGLAAVAAWDHLERIFHHG